jgi:multiple sugar transport system ATP-binding protein
LFGNRLGENMAQVVLKHVWKRYTDFVAVKDFSLTMNDREFIVLVGPSGCGKSTTLRMVAGLEEISDGDIFIGDRRVNDIPPKDRDIAMVFQNYALYPHWTVFENMAFGLKLRKLQRDEIRTRVVEAARVLEIDHLLDRKPKALSGGQRQRVAMGRAIVRNPKVFLFDEPLSNLDAKLRVQMRVEISRLHNRLQTTIIYVTHDQVEAMTLADRIVIMHEGRIQQVGTPLDVYDRPANLFVATFIGSPSMNLIAGRYDGRFISGEGLQLVATESQRARLGSSARDLTVGIRPQHLAGVPAGAEAPRPDSGHPWGRLSGKVEVIEHLGSERFVYFRVAEKQVTARLDPAADSAREGDVGTFSVDVDAVHLFDGDGSNLLLDVSREVQ